MTIRITRLLQNCKNAIQLSLCNRILLLLFLVLSCKTSTTTCDTCDQTLKGKVVAVKDGDTIEVLIEGKAITIRLSDIDCPEKKQPFGTQARQFTSAKCFGQEVVVKHKGKRDRYQRLIAEIINEKGENVNLELVKAGFAWHFKKYSTDNKYAEAEIASRNTRIGIWAEPHPVPPWEWRKK